MAPSSISAEWTLYCTSADIAWGRVNKPADVLSVGQPVDVKVLKLANEGEKTTNFRGTEAASAASMGCRCREIQRWRIACAAR